MSQLLLKNPYLTQAWKTKPSMSQLLLENPYLTHAWKTKPSMSQLLLENPYLTQAQKDGKSVEPGARLSHSTNRYFLKLGSTPLRRTPPGKDTIISSAACRT